MVLLYGIPGDGPFERVADALEELEVPFVLLNPRRFTSMDLVMELNEKGLNGELTIGATSYDLDGFTGIYNRSIDFSQLPEAQELNKEDWVIKHYTRLFELLQQWIEIAPCRVVNRASAMSSNASKPYQLSLIQPYFKVPETLVTNRVDSVKAYYEQERDLIYKSASSIRSIVKTLTPSDLDKLTDIRHCPTLFQKQLKGTNYRVHIVEKKVFAAVINSEVVDYRYSHRQGKETEMQSVRLPEEIEERCIDLARRLNLAVAGIDLFLTDEGEWYCFEVNPSPGFSYFEQQTGQPIAQTVAAYLAGQ